MDIILTTTEFLALKEKRTQQKPNLKQYRIIRGNKMFKENTVDVSI